MGPREGMVEGVPSEEGRRPPAQRHGILSSQGREDKKRRHPEESQVPWCCSVGTDDGQIMTSSSSLLPMMALSSAKQHRAE